MVVKSKKNVDDLRQRFLALSDWFQGCADYVHHSYSSGQGMTLKTLRTSQTEHLNPPPLRFGPLALIQSLDRLCDLFCSACFLPLICRKECIFLCLPCRKK